jgi:membrane protease YdiL (CAAX protease family)
MLDQRSNAPWQPWETLPVFGAALLATLVVSVSLAALTGGIGGITLQLSTLAFPLALTGFTLLWVGIRHRAVDSLKLGSIRGATDVALGSLYGVGLFGLATLAIYPIVQTIWQIVTGHPPSPIRQPVLPADPEPVQVALGVLTVVLAVPLGEEVFFRGMLFGSLRTRMGFARAAAISSLLFALVHVQPPLVILMFFVGFGLAFIYERRGSLVAPIAAHAAFNLIGFTLILLVR